MAPPPRIRSLVAIPGAPEWVEPLFVLLNEALGQLSSALSRRLTRRENFASGEKLGAVWLGSTLRVKWDAEVVEKPRHVWVDGLWETDGNAPAFAWSHTWRLTAAGEIEIIFQDLSDTTTYVCNVTWE